MAAFTASFPRIVEVSPIEAVDRCDDWELAVGNTFPFSELVNQGHLDVAFVCHLLDVCAGCECASGSGENNTADVAIVLASFEADGQVSDKGVAERVECLLTGKCEKSHASTPLGLDVLKDWQINR